MLKNYLKIAWRTILKNRLTSSINIFGLTLGISVCIVILIFAHYESTFDAFHKKADRTFRVVQHNKLPDQTLYWNTTAYPLAEALRNDFPEIDLVTQIAGPFSQIIKVADDTGNENLFEEPDVLFVDSFYPKTFDVTWLAGNQNTALKELNSVVLTESLAQSYFGLNEDNYQSALGKTILLQSQDLLNVTGVVKNPPGNSEHQYQMLVPYELFKANNLYHANNWEGNHQGTTYVVLNDFSSEKNLESKIQGWKKKYLTPQDEERISYFLQPLKEVHNETLYGASPGGYIIPMGVLNLSAGVAIFILLIAIINFVNLVTAQSNSRAKEVGVRKVMGSSRKHLIFQFIFENAMLIAIAAILSGFAVNVLISFLNVNLTILDINLQFQGIHIAAIFFVALATIILAGIYPSLVLSNFQPIRALKEKSRGKVDSKFNFRRWLVVFQFIVVQVFVIAAIVLFYQIDYFLNSELGFDKETVVITEIPNQEKSEVYRDELLLNSEITKVAYGSGPPMAVNGLQLGTSYRLPQQNKGDALDAEMKIGDTHYLDFYDLELLSGRNFLDNKKAFDEFIVNETFLKSYGWNPEEAIGKKIEINEGAATIVGVVKDFHNNALQLEISPVIFLNWKYFLNNTFIKLSEIDNSTLAGIEQKWNLIFENSIYKFEFLDDAIAKEYAVEQLIFMGFGAFSVLAILLGCLGLFGLLAFVVTQKRKEIGIRKVLGATLIDNISVFVKEYIFLVLISFAMAVPLVYYGMNIWLEGFTYHIDLSIWMFLVGGVITLLIAILTCSFQSIQASRINPVKVLRDE